jgi:hypothetical protein
MSLGGLKTMVHASLAELGPCWDDVLPDGLPEDLDISKFSLRDIDDDPTSRESLFDRPGNQALFKKYIDAIWDLLFGGPPSDESPVTRCRRNDSCSPRVTYKNGCRFSPKLAHQYLKRTKALEDANLRSFLETCGVPPRAWQVVLLRYRPLGDLDRNIRIQRGQVIVANPQAKQRDLELYAAFWCLPPQLSPSFIFGLGVIRPIVIRLLERLGEPTAEHKSYVFVRSERKAAGSYVLSPSNVNQVLRESDFKAEVRPLRHVAIGILKRHFPHLMRPSDEGRSPLDKQAQHSPRIHADHYARDEIQRSTGSTVIDSEQQMAVSHGLQHLYELIPSYDLIRSQASTNMLHALWTARDLVERKNPGYDILSKNTQSERKTYVDSIACRIPFLPFLRERVSVSVAIWFFRKSS